MPDTRSFLFLDEIRFRAHLPPAALPCIAGMTVTMTVSAASSVTIAAADKVYGVSWFGKLDVDIGIAMSCSVARAMVDIPCTVCSVAGGTGDGDAGM